MPGPVATLVEQQQKMVYRDFAKAAEIKLRAEGYRPDPLEQGLFAYQVRGDAEESFAKSLLNRADTKTLRPGHRITDRGDMRGEVLGVTPSAVIQKVSPDTVAIHDRDIVMANLGEFLSVNYDPNNFKPPSIARIVKEEYPAIAPNAEAAKAFDEKMEASRNLGKLAELAIVEEVKLRQASEDRLKVTLGDYEGLSADFSDAVTYERLTRPNAAKKDIYRVAEDRLRQAALGSHNSLVAKASEALAEAETIGKRALGTEYVNAKYAQSVARPNRIYRGQIIGETERFVIQKVSDSHTVRHLKDSIMPAPQIGQDVRIKYSQHIGKVVEQAQQQSRARHF